MNNNSVRLTAGSGRTHVNANTHRVQYNAISRQTEVRSGGHVPGQCVQSTNEYQTPPTPPSSGNYWSYYGNVTLVPVDTETTVVSYTVPNNYVILVEGYQMAGNAVGLFTFYVNGNVTSKWQTTAAKLSDTVDFLGGIQQLNPGDRVRLSVMSHDGPANFNATLLGTYNTI